VSKLVEIARAISCSSFAGASTTTTTTTTTTLTTTLVAREVHTRRATCSGDVATRIPRRRSENHLLTIYGGKIEVRVVNVHVRFRSAPSVPARSRSEDRLRGRTGRTVFCIVRYDAMRIWTRRTIVPDARKQMLRNCCAR